MTTRKRCPNGSRKNSAGKCTPCVRLTDDDITQIIQLYGLDNRARPMLKKMRLKKKLKYNPFYKYDPKHSDDTNLDRQARAIIADLLKHGTAEEKRQIQKTPKSKN